MPAILRTLLVLAVVMAAGAPVQSQRRSDVITAAQIDSAVGKGASLYDVVESLRPRWLTKHEVYMGGPGELIKAEGAHVYVNDVDAGDTDHLKTIPAELVVELRWLSANQAASRFGPTSGPAIVVTLKR